MTVLSCYFFTFLLEIWHFYTSVLKDHVASALEAVLHGFLLWENACFLHRVKEDGS